MELIKHKKVEKIKLLKFVGVFFEFTKSELDQVVDNADFFCFDSGETIVEQDKNKETVFIVRSGEFQVFLNNVLYDSVLIRKGSFLGEVPFFSKGSSLMTVKAKVKSEVLAFSHKRLEKLIKNDPSLGLKIYKSFILEILKKLKNLNGYVFFLTSHSPSKQAAHDIRSPIAALKVLARQFPEERQESKDLMSAVVERMEKITRSLLEGGERPSIEEVGVFGICAEVKKLIAEKQVRLGSRSQVSLKVITRLKDSDFLGNVKLNLVELGRAVSNVVENSIESIDGSGTVQVKIVPFQRHLRLEVTDTGRGIPAEVLSILGTRKATFGKPNGNGLGLLHAYRQVSSWKGKMNISSKVGKGTSVSIQLPISY